MGATLTTLTNILKEYYLGPVRDQLNNEILVMQILPLNTEDIQGLKAIVPLHSSRSGGIGSRPELGTLPAAGNQVYKRAEYDLKYHYGRMEVSGPSIAKTRDQSGAFLQAMKAEIDGIKDDLLLDFARQVYGNGDARVETCGVTTAAAVVVLNSDEALLKGHLYVGMVVDIGTASDPNTLVAGETITDTDVAAKTITVASAITTTTANFVYRSANTLGTDATVVYEMDGLQKIFPTAANTLGNLNAAGAGLKFWDNLRTNVAGAVSLSKLMIDANRAYNSGSKPDDLVCLTSLGIARRLFETADFTTNNRFVNTTQMRGGFESISFASGAGRINMVTDRLAPWGKIFFIPKKAVSVYSPADWDFLARDGQAVKWVQDKDAFQSVLFRYANMGASRRNNGVVQYGVTDTGF